MKPSNLLPNIFIFYERRSELENPSPSQLSRLTVARTTEIIMVYSDGSGGISIDLSMLNRKGQVPRPTTHRVYYISRPL